jgi:hypothetical protein
MAYDEAPPCVWFILPAMPKAYEFPCCATIVIEMDLGW